MNTRQFRTDNTDGYSQSDLNTLNAEFERRAAQVTDPDQRQRISEQVLTDFDNGKLCPPPT